MVAQGAIAKARLIETNTPLTAMASVMKMNASQSSLSGRPR